LSLTQWSVAARLALALAVSAGIWLVLWSLL
jgi:hypothetical protein